MSVVTISREFGSDGDTIAKKVAQTLGYHLVDKALIGAVLSQYGMVEFDKEYDELPGFWERFDAQREERRALMADMLNQIIRTVAFHGNVVVVGRSGFAILQDFADVLNIRIQSPLAIRINRVMAQQGVTTEQAETMVKEGDKVRSAFIESFYNVQWDTASAFDLVLDTSKVSPEIVVTWVVQAARTLNERSEDGRPTCDSIQVDSILAAAVSDTLKCKATHR